MTSKADDTSKADETKKAEDTRKAADAPASSKMDRSERKQVGEMAGVKTSVIYEAIRIGGDHELARSVAALWWSGVTAGLAISVSVLCSGFLVSYLPDATWTRMISSLGYPVGFLLVILGRMQLFTENTMTPILSLFRKPGLYNLRRTGRLWAVVFLANMTGCFVAAATMSLGEIMPPERFDGILAVSHHYAEASAREHLLWGIPAGFLIASLVWLLPRMESAGEVMMIFIVTYVIGLGGLSHVVAGSTEIFILVCRGEIGLVHGVTQAILPALLGNVAGGTGLFAVLTYAQVKNEV